MATIQSKGRFLTLVAQLDKLARHNRQGSFRTKERYYEAMKRFCAYPADEYRLQKLSNLPSTLGAMQDFVSTSASVWTPQRRSRRCAKTPSP